MFPDKLKRLRAFLLFCSFVVFLGWSGSALCDDFKSYKDIPYTQSAHSLQMLDIYAPQKRGNSPVLIYVHGGAWMIGDKRSGHQHGAFYADRDIVFVSVNYRLSPDYKHPAHVQDVAAAVKWVKDNIYHYGGDASRVHIVGHSAGAHLVALLGTDPQYLRAHKLGFKALKSVIANDTASFDFSIKPSGRGKRMLKRVIAKAFGTDKVTLSEASPAYHVKRGQRKNFPDFMLFVTDERKDAVKQTLLFEKALERRSDSVSVFVVPKLSHKEMNENMSVEDSVISKEILKVVMKDDVLR